MDGLNPVSNVVDVTLENFEKEVLLASQEKTVVVDFWASWCEPCRTLTPILEAAIAPYGDRAVLAKINVEENPEIASQFQVMGIPLVKAVRNAEIVAEFSGAQPAEMVDSWLQQVVPPEEIDDLKKIEQLLDEGNVSLASSALGPLVAAQPDSTTVRVLQARAHLLQGEVVQGREVLETLQATEEADRAEKMLAVVDMLERSLQSGDPDDSTPEGLLVAAGRSFLEQRFGQSMDQLLELFRRDRAFEDRVAHRVLLGSFEVLGSPRPEVDSARQSLGMLLFS